jgi:hypothetical protein
VTWRDGNYAVQYEPSEVSSPSGILTPAIGGPSKDRFVATFRPDGQLSEIEHYNPDGSMSREIWIYDEAGSLTEDQWWTNVRRARERSIRPALDIGRALVHVRLRSLPDTPLGPVSVRVVPILESDMMNVRRLFLAVHCSIDHPHLAAHL